MLKETLGAFVLIMTSVELAVLFNLVFAATTNCMRQAIISLTFLLNTAWKILANSPVIFLFLLLSKNSQPHITQKFPGMFIIKLLCLLLVEVMADNCNNYTTVPFGKT